MRTMCACLLLILSFASLAAPVPAVQPEYSMQVTGEIEIAPDGSVHGYKLDNGLKPKVRELVAANIDSWKFEPILVDGRAVIAKTRLRMMLEAVPVKEGYRLKVSSVWFGEPTRTSLMNPPRYPQDAARADLGARVVLVLKLDAAGNVVAAHPEQTSLSTKVSGKLADKWRKLFERASIDSASSWKFDVPEIIDGTPAQSSSIRVPVDFIMGSGGLDQWRAYLPGPVTPAPWLERQALVAEAAGNLGNGEMQPLDSRFKLKTNVIGATL